MIWVYELPLEIQSEIRNEIFNILIKLGVDNIEEATERAMNEKLINIIGHEEGLLDAHKYWKYL